MLYDLNIAWSPATAADGLVETLSLAAALGYATVALNCTLELPLPATPTSPFPPLPPWPAAKLPHVLRRATLPLADPAASNYRLPSLAGVYDLLAIRPLTEKAFQTACLTLDVPIISLDLTAFFPFHFRPKPCMAAVARGVRFEICYAQLLAADARGRANFIANVTGLVRATRGRGFVISSEATKALRLRAPADIVNLLSVWGLATDKGLDAFRSIPRSVVVNEAIKRNGFRGVVDVVQLAAKPDGAGDEAAPDAATDQRSAAAQGAGNKANKQKRKPGADDGSQPTSRRQAKKMKLAARSAGPDKTQQP